MSAEPTFHSSYLSKFRDGRDAADLTIEDATIASREAAAVLESMGELLAYLVDHRESDQLSEVGELWSLPDGGRMNSFQFEGPDSFHQLADEFDRVAQAIEDATPNG